MGAFAGSAALLCRKMRSDLSVVTLTMNNTCNLKCPHCYLQFAEDDGYVARWVVESIAQSDVETVAIVGMEPLKNRRSAAELHWIVETMKAQGKNVGVVTNGLNAHLLDPRTASQLDWVDVSVDGLRDTYQSIRGAPVGKLEQGVATLRALGVGQINVLHTLHAENIGHLAELADFGRELAFEGQVILSPFSATRHEGTQPRDLSITPRLFLEAIEDADCDLADCWVVLDLDWLPNESDRTGFAAQVEQRLGGRAVLFRADPYEYGMIRITYDARIMTPRQAMHTSDYRGHTRSLDAVQLRTALAARPSGRSFI